MIKRENYVGDLWTSNDELGISDTHIASIPPPRPEPRFCKTCKHEMSCILRPRGYWEHRCKRCINRRDKERHPNGTWQKRRRARILESNPNYYKELNAQYEKNRRPKVGGKRIRKDELVALVSQSNGLCAICKKPETEKQRSGKVKRLAIDHDHRTGQLRGLLCGACNRGIGFFCDDPARMRAAAEYLELWQNLSK